MKILQTLPRVITQLPQPYQFDNNQKSVQFTLINKKIGVFVVTDYVTGKKQRGAFRFTSARNNVRLFSGLRNIRHLFLSKRDISQLQEA